MVKKTKKKFDDMQLTWIVLTMIITIACLVAIPFVVKAKNNITYEGLTFQKVKYGELEVYYYPYQFIYSNKSYGYNLYIRNNPKSNSVPVNGTIEYPKYGSKMYFSFDFKNLATCSNAIREVTTIRLFLEGNLFKTNISSFNQSYASENNISFANCDNKKNMVVLMQKSNETRIDRYGECYVLSAKDCDSMLDLVEKFEVQSIADAKKNANNN